MALSIKLLLKPSMTVLLCAVCCPFMSITLSLMSVVLRIPRAITSLFLRFVHILKDYVSKNIVFLTSVLFCSIFSNIILCTLFDLILNRDLRIEFS